MRRGDLGRQLVAKRGLTVRTGKKRRNRERQFCSRWRCPVMKGEEQLAGRLNILLARHSISTVCAHALKHGVAECDLPLEGMLAPNRPQRSEEFGGDVSAQPEGCLGLLQIRPLHLLRRALARQLGEPAGDEVIVEAGGHRGSSSAERDVLIVPPEKRR